MTDSLEDALEKCRILQENSDADLCIGVIPEQ